MRYDEFFQAFHEDDRGGHLSNYKTTWAIPKFFAETVLVTPEYIEKLPQDAMSYDKWFQGSASPRNHWGNMSKDYKEETLVNALMGEIENASINELLLKFGVETESTINKDLLCIAIAQQFKAIIDGKGEGANIVTAICKAGNIKADFIDYTKEAIKRYNVMKLIGGEEVPLIDFFVCNTIGEKEKVFADKKKIKCAYLENPNLQSIRDIHMKRRNYDSVRSVLIGSGGCGKSLMLQHLFLEAAKEYPHTGILPVFIELRNFTQGMDMFSHIVETVRRKAKNFTEDAARQLLKVGKCKLLFDGFDEIDPSDMDSFLNKLNAFIDEFSNTQIVITSRKNEYITGLNGFTRLYVWPFDSTQTILLIDKILKYQGNQENKSAILEYINKGFLKKDGVFASHPLLLTYVTMHYPSFKLYNGNRIHFYKQTYEALLSGHDDNKKPYDRVFMSVDNAEQFSTVFKEFCALTYKEAAFKFNSLEFETYFKKLKSYKSFVNPYKMNLENFKHDVFSTACIMYESEYDIFYIDPGFQEYLFAEYYIHAEKDEMEDLRNTLMHIPYEKMLNFNALDMLYKSAELKFKFYIMLPYLNEIFKGDEIEEFTNFLKINFNEINVVNINESNRFLYMEIFKTDITLLAQEENYPKTILLNYIFKLLGIYQEFEYPLYSRDYIPIDGTMMRLTYPSESETTGIVIAQVFQKEDLKQLVIDCKPLEVYEMYSKELKEGKESVYIVDENNELVRFGEMKTIDTYYLSESPEQYRDIIVNIFKSSTRTSDVLSRVKEYHRKLKIEKHRSGIN